MIQELFEFEAFNRLTSRLEIMRLTHEGIFRQVMGPNPKRLFASDQAALDKRRSMEPATPTKAAQGRDITGPMVEYLALRAGRKMEVVKA